MNNQQAEFYRIKRAKSSANFLWSRGFITDEEHHRLLQRVRSESEKYYTKYGLDKGPKFRLTEEISD